MATEKHNQIIPFILTREKFWDCTGLSHATVKSMCDRGYLPTLHIGRRVFVNLIAVQKIAETQADAHFTGHQTVGMGSQKGEKK